MTAQPEQAPPQTFLDACRTVGLTITDAQHAALGRYLHRLLETNKQFNLTAIRDADEAWMRHILDSLSLLPFLEGVETFIDVGSGGGLPGIPVAIVRPDLRVTLLEATGKKARFLASTAAALGLSNVTVLNDRAETVGQDKAHRARYDAAAARAVGPLRSLLELTLPLVKVGGIVLAMKGRQAERELQEAGDALMTLGAGEVHVYEALPGLEDEASIVMIEKASTTPRPYPRLPGIPKHQPL